MSDGGGSSRVGIIVGIVSIFFLILVVTPQIIDPPSSRPLAGDSFATTALAHSLLADSLGASGWTVDRIRIEPRSRVVDSGIVVLAEPNKFDRPMANEIIADLWQESQALLVVLPKRRAIWGMTGDIEASAFRDWGDVQDVLRAFSDLDVIRLGEQERTENWFDLPLGCDAPEVAELQLIKGGIDFPIISCEQGVLFGAMSVWNPDSFEEKTVYILSDPDIIANHGMGKSEANARLAFEVFDYVSKQLDIYGSSRTVYFDEVIHGHGLSRSIWAELFRYPMALVVAHLVFVILLVLWATRRAFGPRLPSPPVIPPGKAYLVGHVASVILQGRHDAYLVSRFFDDCIREVAKALHIETGRIADLEKKLMPRAQAKNVEFEPAAWRSALRSGKAGALDAARKIHAWRKEMLHGA